MKILLSPSKGVNTANMCDAPNDINSIYFKEKLESLVDFEFDNTKSKRAIELYYGVAFKQLECLDDPFYENVIILSSL